MKKKYKTAYKGKFEISILPISLIALFVIIGIVVFEFCTNAWVRRDVTVTVDSKWVKDSPMGNMGQKYLVSGIDESGNEQVYEITDNLLAMRFDSSDVYAKIKEGKTYNFVVGGFRVPILSWYPNIYDVTEITKSAEIESTEAESGVLQE